MLIDTRYFTLLDLTPEEVKKLTDQCTQAKEWQDRLEGHKTLTSNCTITEITLALKSLKEVT